MKRILSSLAFALVALCAMACRAGAAPLPTDSLRNADLLFFAPAADNAITQVTHGTDSLSIDHVAIVQRSPHGICTIEAIHRGVVCMPLDSTLARARRAGETVIAARVTDGLNDSLSVANARSHLGKPYDFYFEPGDSAVYCSELVQISYVDNAGMPVFSTIPMSFHTPDGKILPYWIEFYRRAGRTVPEGAPGTNPAQLSRSPRLKFLFTIPAQHPH